MAKRSSKSRPGRVRRQWMLTPTPDDIDILRRKLSQKGPLWSEWEYKLRAGRIIIYSPVIPWNQQLKPDPRLRYLAMHLRISPAHPGPFQLEFRRHTEEWWPLHSCPPGIITDIAEYIARDQDLWCRPMDQDGWEKSHGVPSRNKHV
ncbi:MAG TPA: hypothetical protein VFE58_03050 [Tepidisphaeraceae bacterium]|nr:hypothetical protein [Tepidisphaeraceae bacterium]